MNRGYHTPKYRVILYSLLTALLLCTHVLAAGKEKLNLVFSPDLDFLMDCSIAIEKGYFKESGLDLDYVSVKGGSAAILSTLLRKEVNGVFLASPTALSAINKGIDLVQISGIGNRSFVYAVLDDSPYQALKDLAGQKIANSPKPTGPWLALKYDLDQAGIQADVIEMQTGGDRVSALLTGHVQACLNSPQFQALYGKRIRTIHTASISKYLWNSCGWWVKREYLNQHPEAARLFVQGLARARKVINANPDEAVEIFSKYGRIRNEKFVEPFQLAHFDDPPRVYQYGLQKIIDILNQYDLLDKHLDAETMVDGRFAVVVDKDY